VLLPLLGFALWHWRHLWPRKAVQARGEQPLDPVRLAALAELALLPKPL